MYLYVIYLLAGLLLALMPFSSKLIMQATLDLSLRVGLVTSLLVFLMPPLLLMGMFSPMVIYQLAESKESSGHVAGKVYAISTLGGVLLTFLLGLWLIPSVGIKKPAIFCGLLMVVLSLLPLFRLLKSKALLGLLVPFILLVFMQFKESKKKGYGNVTIKHSSEGLLGQIKVADVQEVVNEGVVDYRFLLVNNTWQTAVINRPPYFSMFEYVYYFYPIINSFPKGSKALVFGLGGGSIVKKFQEAGFEVKVVDIDKRLKQVATKYFDLDPSTEVVIDDARHYLNKEETQYDVIVFDCFLGESPPAHLLTKEAFGKAKQLLKKDGLLMIEFYGHLTGKPGLATRMLYKTLLNTGFSCKMIATNPNDESKNNVIFVASEQPFKTDSLAPVSFAYNEKKKDWREVVYDANKLEINSVEELTDEKPVLDYLLMESVQEWRAMLNDRFAKVLLQEEYPLFN